jgi:hypothetical protein
MSQFVCEVFAEREPGRPFHSCAPCVKAALSRCQGVKANRASAPLAAPCAVAPRIASCDQEGPAIAPRYLTAAIASGAAVLTVDHEQKSFPEFCGNSREVEVSDDAMRQCAALTNSVRRVTCYDLLTQLRVTEPSETTGQRGGMGLTTTIDGIIDHRWGERDPKIDTTAGYNQR